VIAILQRLNAERGVTVLLVTHEQEITEYAARVIAFLDGRVRSDRRVDAPRSAAADLETLRRADASLQATA